MIDLDRILRFGVRQLFAGSRRGQPVVAAFGAALAIVTWLRKRDAASRLLFAEDLEEGKTMQITFRRGSEIVETATIEG